MKVYKFKCEDCGARKYIKLDGKNCQIYKCCYCGSIVEVSKMPKEELKKETETITGRNDDIKGAEFKLQKQKVIFTRRIIELLLCFFLGTWGVHRFAQRKFFTGLIYLFTFGVFGIGVFIDILRGIIAVANARHELDLIESEYYYAGNELGDDYE